jgi:hypothetical protein
MHIAGRRLPIWLIAVTGALLALLAGPVLG